MLILQVEQSYYNLLSFLKYTIDVFNMSYDTQTDILIGYGEVEDADIKVTPGDTTFFQNKSNSTPQEKCWVRWKAQDIPVLFQREIDTIMTIHDGQVKINFDVLLSSFYFLSSWEEVYNRQRDRFGRFPASESFLYKENLLKKPIVNYYFDILRDAVFKITKARLTPKFSENNKYPVTCIMTHDIDKCMTGWRENAFRAFISGNIKETLKTLWNKMSNKDIWFNLEYIMDLEDSLNLKSAFYFIPNKKRYKKHPNADYDITSNRMMGSLNKIKERKFEIGIHHSLGTGWNQKEFLKEIKNFPENPAGGRFHFLAMSLPESYMIIENSDLSYDTTYGFPEQVGFRNGFCFPYKPYNHHSNSAHSFTQLPLTIMDWTFIGKQYLNLQPEEVYPLIEEIIDEVEKFMGVIVVLWHNSSFTGFKYKGWDQPFKWLIQDIKKRKGRFVKPVEIISNK